MMLEIPTLVEALAPNAGTSAAMRVVRIETTHAVYLVFDSTSSAPKWVVRVGPKDVVTHAAGVLSTLHALAPNLVAQSLACQPWRNGMWVHVQSGLDGQPWFRIQQRLTTTEQWDKAKRMARTALTELHTTIRSHTPWTMEVDVAARLAASAAELDGLGLLTPAIRDAFADAEAQCRTWRTQSHLQHGDFCFNNLLLSDNAKIVDFDEFGLTAMPLHDELSLALSFDEMVPGSLRQSLADQIAFVMEPQPDGWQDRLWPLWLHHVAWRVATSSRIPNRRYAVERWHSLLVATAEQRHAAADVLQRIDKARTITTDTQSS